MIFHILKKSEWEQALLRGTYEPASLGREGFVHCSTRDQTVGTANRFYRGQTDLVLLCIDPRLLTAELRYENPANPADERARELFPHVYGPVNREAVIRVVDFPFDGASFQLPAEY